MSNIFIGLKMTCLGVLDRGERDKDNETDTYLDLLVDSNENHTYIS